MMQGGPGKVYACEVQQELIEELRSQALKAHLSLNIEVLWVNIEKRGGTKLAEGSMDAGIISNVLFQIEDKNSFSQEAGRIIKKDGKILLIDWLESFNHMGPHPDHVVTKEQARSLFERAGFEFVKEIDAGAHHYGMVLRKI
jgi:SAM-dependent methyltransferase